MTPQRRQAVYLAGVAGVPYLPLRRQNKPLVPLSSERDFKNSPIFFGAQVRKICIYYHTNFFDFQYRLFRGLVAIDVTSLPASSCPRLNSLERWRIACELWPENRHRTVSYYSLSVCIPYAEKPDTFRLVLSYETSHDRWKVPRRVPNLLEVK